MSGVISNWETAMKFHGKPPSNRARSVSSATQIAAPLNDHTRRPDQEPGRWKFDFSMSSVSQVHTAGNNARYALKASQPRTLNTGAGMSSSQYSDTSQKTSPAP